MRTPKLVVLSLLLNAMVLMWVACGGGGNNNSGVGGSNPPPGGPPASAQKSPLHVGAIPGFHGTAATKKTAFEFSIVPKVFAQVQQSISMAGTYSGFCTNTLSLGEPRAIVVYGGGQLGSADCSTQQTAISGLGAAQSAKDGQLVIGDGVLGPLVCFDADESFHAVPNGAEAEVFIRRKGSLNPGQVIETGMKCSFGPEHRGSTTATFPVLDGDKVIVTLLQQAGEGSRGFQFYLSKL